MEEEEKVEEEFQELGFDREQPDEAHTALEDKENDEETATESVIGAEGDPPGHEGAEGPPGEEE